MEETLMSVVWRHASLHSNGGSARAASKGTCILARAISFERATSSVAAFASNVDVFVPSSLIVTQDWRPCARFDDALSLDSSADRRLVRKARRAAGDAAQQWGVFSGCSASSGVARTERGQQGVTKSGGVEEVSCKCGALVGDADSSSDASDNEGGRVIEISTQ